MPTDAMDRLRAVVLADPELQRRLLVEADRRDFVALLVGLAGERGIDLDAHDVDEAIVESRRAWYATWI